MTTIANRSWELVDRDLSHLKDAPAEGVRVLRRVKDGVVVAELPLLSREVDELRQILEPLRS